MFSFPDGGESDVPTRQHSTGPPSSATSVLCDPGQSTGEPPEALWDCSSSVQEEQYCFNCQRKGAPRGFLKSIPVYFQKRQTAAQHC